MKERKKGKKGNLLLSFLPRCTHNDTEIGAHTSIYKPAGWCDTLCEKWSRLMVMKMKGGRVHGDAVM